MKHSFDSFFYSKKERRGLILLISTVLMIFFSWRLLPVLMIPNPSEDQVRLTSKWEEFKSNSLPAASKKNPTVKKENNNYILVDSTETHAEKRVVNLFDFDPNTATREDFLNLGLPLKTVNILLNFRNKGGRFYRKEDVQKIYTLNEEDYKRLEPYIVLAKPQQRESQSFNTGKREYSEKPALMIELNSADTLELRKIRGIGPYYSRLIIFYRNSLGGFFDIDQLQEISRLPDSTFQAIKPYIKVNPELIQKIKINSVSEKDLNQHPYMSKRLAKQIIKFRNEQESFENFSDLKLIPLINDENYRKIAPYLSLD